METAVAISSHICYQTDLQNEQEPSNDKFPLSELKLSQPSYKDILKW